MIRRVFEGGAGVESGGRFERSRDKGERGVDRPEDRRDKRVGEVDSFGGLVAMLEEDVRLTKVSEIQGEPAGYSKLRSSRCMKQSAQS